MAPTEKDMAAIPPDSIDYAVMEKSARVTVVPFSIGWSDLGSWDAVYDARHKDGNDNAAGPELLAVNARGNLVVGSGRRIALVGVEDLIIVETTDAILVTRRGKSQDVKAVTETLIVRNEKGTL